MILFCHNLCSSQIKFTFQGANFRFPREMWDAAEISIMDLFLRLEITEVHKPGEVLSFCLGDTRHNAIHFVWRPLSRLTFEKEIEFFVNDLFGIVAEFLVPVDPPTINNVCVGWNINEGSKSVFNLAVEGTSAVICCQSTDDGSSFRLTVTHSVSWIDTFLQRQAHMIKCLAAENADRLARMVRRRAMILLIRYRQHLLQLEQEKKKMGKFIFVFCCLATVLSIILGR
jgi:hypothetical protein